MSNNKDKDLEILRHSLSHVMANAVLRLWSDVKFAIGPAIDNGFYYDFDFGDQKISDEDLERIEEEMKKIIGDKLEFKRFELSIDEALKKAVKDEQIYKKELIEDLKSNGEQKVSYYELGEFTDLCRGPHVETSGDLPLDSFKLTKLAGAYWRGDEKNKMLTRIYAVAFATKKELDDYLQMIEEAEKRDHRKIGKEQELFIIDPVVGLGLAMWQPKGAMLWRVMEDFWYKAHLENGYELVRSPHIGSRQLWETSGHWGYYSNSMYPSLEVGRNLEEVELGVKNDAPKEEYLLKPMNCPFHVVMYNAKPHSYRELPIRWAECGTVYRYEKSGELSGLTRVRGFTQDDAHIICAKEQVKDELKRVAKFIAYIFGTFGFKEYKVYLSLRDPSDKQKYAGNDEGWEFTQKVLEEVAQEEKLDYVREEGEAAFYGPKLDYKVKDCLGREWQCSTLQFDFNLPERFDMTFTNSKGEKERPYMLHRALFGSFERFVGVLIEHYAGAFPVWLSPVQIKLVAVGEKHIDFVQKLASEFKKENIRIETDISNETVSNKIRKAVAEKMPYMLVIGDKEMNSENLIVRDRGSKDTREISKADFIQEIKSKIENKN
jgi:threonyl-tRNA synthetase